MIAPRIGAAALYAAPGIDLDGDGKVTLDEFEAFDRRRTRGAAHR